MRGVPVHIYKESILIAHRLQIFSFVIERKLKSLSSYIEVNGKIACLHWKMDQALSTGKYVFG